MSGRSFSFSSLNSSQPQLACKLLYSYLLFSADTFLSLTPSFIASNVADSKQRNKVVRQNGNPLIYLQCDHSSEKNNFKFEFIHFAVGKSNSRPHPPVKQFAYDAVQNNFLLAHLLLVFPLSLVFVSLGVCVCVCLHAWMRRSYSGSCFHRCTMHLYRSIFQETTRLYTAEDLKLAREFTILWISKLSFYGIRV